MKIFILFLFLINTHNIFAKDTNKGYQLAKNAEVANSGFVGEQAELEMILVNARGDKVTRKLTNKIKEVPSDNDKSLFTFLWPADVKGTKLLTWAHKDKDDDQWLYLPALKRVKRISSKNKTGSFMGSEFSYEEIGSQDIDKYTYKFIKDDELSARKVWVIDRVPKSKDSGYSKQTVYLDKEYMLPIQVAYYDRKKQPYKTAVFTSWKKYGKFWRAQVSTMSNVQTKKKSILKIKNLIINKAFSDKIFTQGRLKK